MKTVMKIIAVLCCIIGIAGIVLFGLCTVLTVVMGELEDTKLMLGLTVYFVFIFLLGKKLKKSSTMSNKALHESVYQPPTHKVICPHCGGPNEVITYKTGKCEYCGMPIK